MFEARKLYRRIIAPIALLLAANVAVFAWLVWRQLSEDAATNLHGYASNLDRMLIAILKESMRKDDRDHLRGAMRDFGGLEWVRDARIIDKEGVIRFASAPEAAGRIVSLASEDCRGCHRRDPVPASTMVVLDEAGAGGSLLRSSETIRAEQSCLECHQVPVGTPLGVLVVDLDMAPISHDVRTRASRNLWFLVVGSAILLAILVYLVRTVVVGRIHSLADAVSALRAGERVAAPDAPVDEIDDLKETLAALGADLEGRQFAAALLRRAERLLNRHDAPILLIDRDGVVLIANDDAQAELGAGLAGVAGRSYVELDPARAALWARAQHAPLVLDPEDRAERGPGGATRALASLADSEGGVFGFLEVGQRVVREQSEDAAATEGTEAAPTPRPLLPESFLHGPYRTASDTSDHFLRGLLLLGSITRESLDKGGVLELDPTLANTLRTFDRLLQFREVIDGQIDRCDMGTIVRTTTNDFQRAHAAGTRWHVLPIPPTPIVGHSVLLRQLVTLGLEQAVETRPRDVVVFLQRQRTRPRFFFGVWASAVEGRAPNGDSPRWQAFIDIAQRFNGTVELSPGYELADLKRVYPGRLPKQLGRGTLFLVEFPCTLG